MRRVLAVALLICAGVSGPAVAHDLRHTVSESKAVGVKLFFADGEPFDFERYEIFRAGEETPFQVGRTDSLGRLLFLPDREGSWRIRVFSEDGHGADFSITAGVHGGLEEVERPLLERHLRTAVGLSLLFGLFGLVALFAPRRKAG